MIPLPTPEHIHQYITQGLVCTHVHVTGDGQHFQALIVSATFFGKSLIERHRHVYSILGDRMKAEIHALSMKTLTPEEYHG